MLRQIKHGEVLIFEVKTLPKGLKKVELKNDFVVVGESETHGNDHRVAVADKLEVEFYEDEKSRLYMKNVAKTNIYCPKEGRHDKTEIPASIWEFDKAKEFDYVNNQIREVRD